MHRQHRLLGKNRDSTLPLLIIPFQIGISFIYTPYAADNTTFIQHCFRQCCFPCIHMGENSHYDCLHVLLLIAFCVTAPYSHSDPSTYLIIT